MDNLIQNLATNLIPAARTSPGGWRSFNCPACIHTGHPRPDTRSRGGLLLEPNGGVRYHCFNCDYSASWTPGAVLSSKIKKMFVWLGATDQNIKEAVFFAFKLKETQGVPHTQQTKKENHIEEIVLPKDAKSFIDLAKMDIPPIGFLNALNYINERNENMIEWFPYFHWSPKMPERVIVPYYSHGQICGWTARLIREPKNKHELRYRNNAANLKFLCNADVIYKKNREFIVVVEGVFDAFAVDGVSVLGSKISELQQRNIEATNKEIIILADRDKAGEKMVDIALGFGWSVSFPPFDKNEKGKKIKDAMDAVNYYGRLMTIKLILENKETNPLIINLKRKEWFK